MMNKVSVKYLDKAALEEHYLKKPVQEINEPISNGSAPKVSVVFITFNHAPYIKDALEAVLCQETDFPYEVLLGDDGSTDGTREICLDYAKRFPNKIRLFLHHRENNLPVLGRPCHIFQYTYNYLHSRGNYVAVCSGDDIWTDCRKLQKQADYLEANKDVALCYHQWFDLYSDGQKSPLKAGMPKASTMMMRNIKDKLPYQFLEVIQEDVFSWFILKDVGRFDRLDGIDPTIVNCPTESITRSISSYQTYQQILNLQRKIFKAYRGTTREEEARYEYMYLLKQALTSSAFKGNRRKCVWETLEALKEDGLLYNVAKELVSKIYKSL